jgi:ABC-2 type transport system permease protein
MHAPLAVLWRILAFVGKELVETIRRPGAIVSLVLGPFLIMALFGVGFDGIRRPLETIVVAPASR